MSFSKAIIPWILLCHSLPGLATEPTDPWDAMSTWNMPIVQGWMDEWLRQAKPVVIPGVSFRYSDWGVPLSSAAPSAEPPEHPAGWSRYRYLWERRNHLNSWNLCSLGEYLLRRRDNRSLDSCAHTLPDPDS